MTTREEVAETTEELLGWLTGPDSGQNDGIIRAVNQLSALLAERDELDAVNDQAVGRVQDLLAESATLLAERDAARAECEAHKARADRYDTEVACASILRAEVERMRETLDMCMVGGNHLATHINLDGPDWRKPTSEGLAFYGAGPSYDQWCCWRAIMQARAALAGAPSHE